MHPQSQPPQSSVLDKFAMMLGAVAGFLGTMPLYFYSFEYFFSYVLQHADYEAFWLWKGAWILCLFFFIMNATWLGLKALVYAPGTIMVWLGILYRLMRR